MRPKKIIRYIYFSIFIVLMTLQLQGTNVRESAKHPYHVGSIEWRLNPKTQKMEITVKMFTDDAEFGLKKHLGKAIRINSDINTDHNKKQIATYFGKHLSLQINTKNIALAYLGAEESQESTYFYLIGDVPKNIIQMQTHCSLLYDIYQDQMFIQHFLIGNRNLAKSAKTMHPNPVLQVDLLKQ